ncbi:unnamed protein product [Closterium sp. Yama58-4]|nr:unnamed protein product [Closterium sp. Yama58-4]
MAGEGVTTAVNELIREAVLAAVREELAAHKEEVDELRHKLTAVQRELAAVKGEFAAVKGELSVLKGELVVVKGELVEHKDAMAGKVVENSRASVGTGLGGKSRKRKQELTANVAREEERREVQALNQPRAMEDLAASKEGPKKRNLKLNVALQIKQINLKELELIKTNVTDAGLAHLTGLSSLILLWLSACKGVTNAGMVHVGKLTGLMHLWLHGTAVTDDGLQQLTALTNLRDLPR